MDTPKIMDKFAETSKQSLDIRTSHGNFKQNQRHIEKQKKQSWGIRKSHGKSEKCHGQIEKVMEHSNKSLNIENMFFFQKS